MKPFSFRTIAACAALFALLPAAFAKPAATVETTVASVDRHGNVNLAVTGTLFSAKGFGLSDIVTVKVGSLKFDAPVGKNYSDVDNGAYILRINDEEVSLAINMGNLAAAAGAKEGTPVTVTMKEKLGYLRTYQTRLLTKGTDRASFASDEVFANFRAVKGGKLAANRLYRSTNPIETDERAPYAAALAEKARVAAVVNLADTKAAASARIAAAPYYASLSQAGAVTYIGMGASITDAAFASSLHDALSFMAKRKGSYYIHGKEGRTRTGAVCAILAALCGATLDEITEDYMLTYENYYGVRRNSLPYTSLSQSVPDIFKALNGGKAVTDKNLLQVTEKYLLKTAKLTQGELDALRANLQ